MRVIIALVLIFSLPAALANDDVAHYMWRDDQGVLNFSEVPPTDTSFEEVAEPERPFGYLEESDAAITEGSAEDDGAESLDVLPTEEGEIDSRQVRDINDLVRARSCEAARRTLETLTSFKQIIVRGDDGIWKEVGEDVKNREIKLAQEAIHEFCDTSA